MRFSASSDGALLVHDQQRWAHWLTKHRGQLIEVELRDAKAIRSNRQNKFWWAVVIPLVRGQWEREKATLISPEFVHDALVGAFGGDWRDTPLGRARRSSTDMTIEEFSKLIEQTSEYLKDQYGCVLPSPEEWNE